MNTDRVVTCLKDFLLEEVCKVLNGHPFVRRIRRTSNDVWGKEIRIPYVKSQIIDTLKTQIETFMIPDNLIKNPDSWLERKNFIEHIKNHETSSWLFHASKNGPTTIPNLMLGEKFYNLDGNRPIYIKQYSLSLDLLMSICIDYDLNFVFLNEEHFKDIEKEYFNRFGKLSERLCNRRCLEIDKVFICSEWELNDSDRSYFLNTSDWLIEQLCDWKLRMNEDRKYIKCVDGVIFISYEKYFDLICTNPTKQVVLQLKEKYNDII